MDKVELAGSLVAKAWSTFVDESEKIVKMVKENADFLAIWRCKVQCVT